MISSRDMSNANSMSTKQRLKRAFHLHKAGVALSTEDMDLLFPINHAGKSYDSSSSHLFPSFVTPISDPPPHAAHPVPASLPPLPPPSALGLGSSLLMQFKQLKESQVDLSHTEKHESDEEEEEEDSNSSEGEEEQEGEEEGGVSAVEREHWEKEGNIQRESPVTWLESDREAHPSYHAVEMVLPIDMSGRIISGPRPTGRVERDGKNVRNILIRDPLIQVREFF
jgi:hypothetical protein